MKTKLFLMLGIAVSVIFTLPGCAKKQGCTDATATNYDASAEEDDGSCVFPIPGCMDPTAENYNPLATVDDGSCVSARDKFIGTYLCQEVCGPDNYTYTMTIVTSLAGDLKVIIQNLGDFATQVDALATVSGSNITIDAATYNNISFTGSGTISGNVLTLTYTATDVSSGNNITCTVTATKQ